MIFDHLAVADLMTFARTSKRTREMVYDDTRWVARLKAIGCWNDVEARQRFDESRMKKVEAMKGHKTENSADYDPGGHVNAARRSRSDSAPFDAGVERRRRQSVKGSLDKTGVNGLTDGFDAIALSPTGQANGYSTLPANAKSALHVLERVKSIRGHARQEYGKVHGALSPFYLDLIRSQDHNQASLFQVFHDPVHQAKVLTQLRKFAQSDTIQGSSQRKEVLDSMSALFENAALREFEHGYKGHDIDQMKKYGHVLVQLNGGSSAIDSYISNHWMMHDKTKLGNPLDPLYEAIPPDISLKPSHDFFQRLSRALNEESLKIGLVFPASVDALTPFVDRVGDDIISDYVTTLFGEAHNGNLESYLKLVPGVYEQAVHFARSLKPAENSPKTFKQKALEIVNRSFEPHADLYLHEEFEAFTSKTQAEVARWERQLSEQEASAESFFMSNVNRQAAKADFLTSFKKVLMMPVSVLPSMTMTKQQQQQQQNAQNNSSGHLATSSEASDLRTSTPSPSGDIGGGNRRSASPRPDNLPTTELAAKAAIMNSKLEGIGSLFSIEVALTLVHATKSSIERAGHFSLLGGKHGAQAREQCEAIFTHLLQILGFRHIKAGFDKAVDHLNSYNARQMTDQSPSVSSDTESDGEPKIRVRPLVTFLELVNVGDLIQQMVDAFYQQELVQPKLSDRDDFLNPATKEKKRFEQMLDERVAAGLNRGIDVLVDEVDFICATTQAPTDYNPGSAVSNTATRGVEKTEIDIGPTPTAKAVVSLISAHTTMLAGSTDKNLLDVFNQEVGLRLFNALCKHLKRQRISVDGAIRLIADVNCYYDYIQKLRNRDLLRYFAALRELAQIFLVDCNVGHKGRGSSVSSDPTAAAKASNSKNKKTHSNAKEIASIVADKDRYQGVLRSEEVYEFAERRADWLIIKREVERHMFGIGCCVM